MFSYSYPRLAQAPTPTPTPQPAPGVPAPMGPAAVPANGMVGLMASPAIFGIPVVPVALGVGAALLLGSLLAKPVRRARRRK